MLLESLDFKDARVLAVDDNPVNLELVNDNLEAAGYAVTLARSGEEALQCLETDAFDVVLLDVMMPGMDGFEVCERIKQDERTHLLPVVMITALDKREDRVRGISAGADDFLHKPFDASELLARVKACIRLKRLTDELETAERILTALSNAIEAKDAYTEGHVERVALYSVEIGKRLGLSNDRLRLLHLGGLLHDIGKIGIPEAILNKPGPLDDDEWVVMKRHPEIGEKICRPLTSLRAILPMIRCHHERPDGSGYPDGLKGDEIALEARIVCLADVFDALATARSYKPAFPREKCIEILQEEVAEGRQDPDVARAFLDYLAEREQAKQESVERRRAEGES